MSEKTGSTVLDDLQMSMYEAACARIDADRIKQVLFDLTNIHSPTGATREASEYIVHRLEQMGLHSRIDPMSEISGNVLGEKRGDGGGACLLLYSPIDTHLEADETDYPWAGQRGFVDLEPKAKIVGDWVYGLGSSNPKAMAASMMEVANALTDAGVPLMGDLMLGFADGGMPLTVPDRNNIGMSSGIQHLLNRGMAPDFALIMKPWNWVYHEEPGMGWFKIQIKGTLGYCGVPRGTPGFRSSVLPLAVLLPELEQWLVDYAEHNRSGQVYPHGWISGVRGGWIERPAFPSAVTEVFFDARINPRTSPAAVKAQFAEFMADFSERHPDIETDWEMYGSVPGGTTDPDNWIIKTALRGWEHVEGRTHGEPDPLGGQTDGAALRRFGIPTARVGWPWPAANSPEPMSEGLGGMGGTFVPDLVPCIQKMLYCCIDTLTRSRSDLGL